MAALGAYLLFFDNNICSKQVFKNISQKMTDKYSMKAIEEQIGELRAQRKQKQEKQIKKLSDQYKLNYYHCRREKGHCFKYLAGEQSEKMTYEEIQKYFNLEAEAKKYKIALAEKEAAKWKQSYRLLLAEKQSCSREIEQLKEEHKQQMAKLQEKVNTNHERHQLELLKNQISKKSDKPPIQAQEYRQMISKFIDDVQNLINELASEDLLEVIEGENSFKGDPYDLEKVTKQVENILEYTKVPEQDNEDYKNELSQKDKQLSEKTKENQKLTKELKKIKQQLQNEKTAANSSIKAQESEDE